MQAKSDVPPPVRIPVDLAKGARERRQQRRLGFWLALGVALAVAALVIYSSGPHTQTREALALLVALAAVLPLFVSLLYVNDVLDWRRLQADQAARRFGELEAPLGEELAMSRLKMVLRRTGQLRVAPNFVGTTGDLSYLVVSAHARQAGKNRHEWVLEVDDEVTVLLSRITSVADIEAAFPELVFREAALRLPTASAPGRGAGGAAPILALERNGFARYYRRVQLMERYPRG